mmetsp:Transcript_49132/g.59549  ORF Transcript_49132/g.59549 Transcript_49132/m.59549 type:complete len:198 (-) Transcript_49132:94-687(-)
MIHNIVFFLFLLTSTQVRSFTSSRSVSHKPFVVTTLFAKKKKVSSSTIAVNKLAYRNYEILETLECGISLVGTEVKSIRDGKMNIRDGFVKPTNNCKGLTLHNVHIGKHSHSAAYFNHEERRVRPLLVHRGEALRLKQKMEQKNLEIVPVKAYFNNQNRIKFEIALAKRKNLEDKRDSIMAREAKRDANRMIKNFRM